MLAFIRVSGSSDTVVSDSSERSPTVGGEFKTAGAPRVLGIGSDGPRIRLFHGE